MFARFAPPPSAPYPPRCLSRAERQYLDAVYGVVRRHGNSVALTKLSNPTCPAFYVPRLAAVFPGKKLKVVLESEDDRLSIRRHENGTCIVCANETDTPPSVRQQPPANATAAVCCRTSSSLSLISQFRDLPADPSLSLEELYPLLQYVRRQFGASSSLDRLSCKIDRAQILFGPDAAHPPNGWGLRLASNGEQPSPNPAVCFGAFEEQQSADSMRTAGDISCAGSHAPHLRHPGGLGSTRSNPASAGVYNSHSPFGTAPPPPPPPVLANLIWAPLLPMFAPAPPAPKPASGVSAGEFDFWWQQLMSHRAEQAGHSQPQHSRPSAGRCDLAGPWGIAAPLPQPWPHQDEGCSLLQYVPSETASGSTGEDDIGSASEL